MSQMGYTDTPLLPGGKWTVHDSRRPQPPVIDPGTASTQDRPGRPPSDAAILFDGRDLAKWEATKAPGPAAWKVADGCMEVVPGTGDIRTREGFGDCQLHVEFAEPTVIKGESQGRGNSGVFLMEKYEIQVLDGYQNLTYPDGTTAAMYGQYPPLFNACRKPGEWQTYDVMFVAPRFEGPRLLTPAFITVIHNGVVVQYHRQLQGPTYHKRLSCYVPHDVRGALRLQDHGDLVRYRNIWIRPLDYYEAP